MYTPDPFRLTDKGAAYGVIETYPFGLLTVTKSGRIDAAHIPFLLDRQRKALRCHVAAENPICHGIDGAEALAVFSGPHCYISPRLCEAATFVPTWNYVAVHVRGAAKTLSEDELELLIQNLTATHEGQAPWSPMELPDGVYRRMLKGIVGIEIPIAEIEGKAKLSQNRTKAERIEQAEILRRSEDPNGQSIAYLMAGLD